MKYIAILKCNNEKTGDSFIGESESDAVLFFSNKKQIHPTDWLKIYEIKNETI